MCSLLSINFPVSREGGDNLVPPYYVPGICAHVYARFTVSPYTRSRVTRKYELLGLPLAHANIHIKKHVMAKYDSPRMCRGSESSDSVPRSMYSEKMVDYR